MVNSMFQLELKRWVSLDTLNWLSPPTTPTSPPLNPFQSEVRLRRASVSERSANNFSDPTKHLKSVYLLMQFETIVPRLDW